MGGKNRIFLKTKIFYYLRLAPLKAKLCHSRKAAPRLCPPLSRPPPPPAPHRLPLPSQGLKPGGIQNGGPTQCLPGCSVTLNPPSPALPATARHPPAPHGERDAPELWGKGQRAGAARGISVRLRQGTGATSATERHDGTAAGSRHTDPPLTAAWRAHGAEGSGPPGRRPAQAPRPGRARRPRAASPRGRERRLGSFATHQLAAGVQLTVELRHAQPVRGWLRARLGLRCRRAGALLRGGLHGRVRGEPRQPPHQAGTGGTRTRGPQTPPPRAGAARARPASPPPA